MARHATPPPPPPLGPQGAPCHRSSPSHWTELSAPKRRLGLIKVSLGFRRDSLHRMHKSLLGSDEVGQKPSTACAWRTRESGSRRTLRHAAQRIAMLRAAAALCAVVTRTAADAVSRTLLCAGTNHDTTLRSRRICTISRGIFRYKVTHSFWGCPATSPSPCSAAALVDQACMPLPPNTCLPGQPGSSVS